MPPASAGAGAIFAIGLVAVLFAACGAGDESDTTEPTPKASDASTETEDSAKIHAGISCRRFRGTLLGEPRYRRLLVDWVSRRLSPRRHPFATHPIEALDHLKLMAQVCRRGADTLGEAFEKARSAKGP
jgi:hypothetical protein